MVDWVGKEVCVIVSGCYDGVFISGVYLILMIVDSVELVV